MGWEVELWNKEDDRLSFGIDLNTVRVRPHPLPKMNRPLTSDIIRHDEAIEVCISDT